MLSGWKQLQNEVSGPFLTALGLGACFLGFVTWDQSHWWRIKEDYSFGWLVPLFVIFVVKDRWPKIVAAQASCAASGSPRAAGWQKWLLRLAVGGLLVAGVLMFLLGAVYRAGAGTAQPATLAITLGAVAILLALLFLNTPAPAAAPLEAGANATTDGGLFSDARVKLAALFLFPVLVWLISAPLVSAVEIQLNLALLRQVVTVVAFVFEVLGLPIEQHGNVLVLPKGAVGVEEACSGIRSLTGCLFAGSFLAAVFLDRFWKKVLLVGAAMVGALIMNLIRSLFLTAWAYTNGPEAIEGTVHDAAGYAVLGGTVVGLLILVWLLNLQIGPAKSETETNKA